MTIMTHSSTVYTPTPSSTSPFPPIQPPPTPHLPIFCTRYSTNSISCIGNATWTLIMVMSGRIVDMAVKLTVTRWFLGYVKVPVLTLVAKVLLVVNAQHARIITLNPPNADKVTTHHLYKPFCVTIYLDLPVLWYIIRRRIQ